MFHHHPLGSQGAVLLPLLFIQSLVFTALVRQLAVSMQVWEALITSVHLQTNTGMQPNLTFFEYSEIMLSSSSYLHTIDFSGTNNQL